MISLARQLLGCRVSEKETDDPRGLFIYIASYRRKPPICYINVNMSSTKQVKMWRRVWMISLRCDSESTDDADDWRRKDKASTT